MRAGIALMLACALCACEASPELGKQTEEPAASYAQLKMGTWNLPVFTSPSAQPDLIETPDGLLLSWVENEGGAHTLKLAAFDGRQWAATHTVSRGSDWFVNWADTPHVAVSGDVWWAHWLRKSGGGTYAYDVVLTQSRDAGLSWSAPLQVNTDDVAGEHGFVSMWPQAEGGIGLAWLDGRNAAIANGAAHQGHGGGAMSLRAALFDNSMQRLSESEVDARVCDCCQTAVAQTARGPLLVYRDRDPHEIRDIAVTRFDGAHWTRPALVHADDWKMPACPVNGPAVTAQGERAWVAWYTAADNQPRVRLAVSEDAGDHFAAPIEVESGAAVQGRAALAAGGDAVWLAWIREDAKGQSLQLARYRPDLSGQASQIIVAKLQGRGRATGFPQLAVRNGVAYLVWTDVIEGAPRLHGARVESHPPAQR